MSKAGKLQYDEDEGDHRRVIGRFHNARPPPQKRNSLHDLDADPDPCENHPAPYQGEARKRHDHQHRQHRKGRSVAYPIRAPNDRGDAHGQKSGRQDPRKGEREHQTRPSGPAEDSRDM